jgi:hypothetical protein
MCKFMIRLECKDILILTLARRKKLVDRSTSITVYDDPVIVPGIKHS